MKFRSLLVGTLAYIAAGTAIAEWQWSLLPGKDKGRKIPQIEYKLAAINSFQQVLDEWEPVTNIGAKVCDPNIKELKVLDMALEIDYASFYFFDSLLSYIAFAVVS